MPYISSSGQVYTIDGPRQRRVQLEKPILLAVAMLLCVFVLARQGTAALASAVHVNRGVPAAQLHTTYKGRGGKLSVEFMPKTAVAAPAGEDKPLEELERIRDRNLVGILRALETNRWGAGELLADQRDRFAREPD